MGLHKGWDRGLFTLNGNVMTSGGSINLAKGQLGIFDAKQRTKDGLVAVNDFSSAGRNDLFQLQVGNNDIQVTRGLANKSRKSRNFKISEVKDLQVYAPNQDKKVDKFLVGYDGINVSTALTFEKGVTEVMSIKLSGGLIEILGYDEGCTYLNVHFEKESEDQTDHEVVEKAVAALKRDVLKEMVPVTDAINISTINSENPATIDGAGYTFYELEVVDEGDSNALGMVQAQFGIGVKRTKRDGLVSTYTLLQPTIAGGGVPSDFVVADADDISWTAGEECQATVKEFTIQLADNENPGDRLSELQAAYPDLTIAIQGTASRDLTLSGTSGTANINIAGVNYLSTFNTSLTTTASDFVTAHAASILSDSGVVVTANAGVLTFEGENIVLDNISIAGATGDLGGTLGTSTAVSTEEGACQTVYITEIASDVVCEDCDPVLRNNFEFEHPADFGFYSWVAAPTVFSANALMGIKIEGKETVQLPGEYLRDGVPFIDTSVRVSVAGGFRSSSYMSFTEGSGDRFAVKVLQRAEDLENLGGNLWELEDRSFTYFQGYDRHRNADGHQNEYIKALLGEESVLKGNAQYITYVLTVQPKSHSQGFASQLEETFNYTIFVEVGKQAGVEALLNALATEAGIDTVQAIA